MQLPYNWGRPADVSGVFSLGDGEWIMTWSPNQVHPYTAQWLEWATRFGPPGRLAPAQPDLWLYGLQVKDLAD